MTKYEKIALMDDLLPIDKEEIDWMEETDLLTFIDRVNEAWTELRPYL